MRTSKSPRTIEDIKKAIRSVKADIIGDSIKNRKLVAKLEKLIREEERFDDNE